MDWQAAKEEELDVAAEMEGLDLDSLEFLDVLGGSSELSDFPTDLLPSGDRPQQPQFFTEGVLASHPFFSSAHEQNEHNFQQHQQNQGTMFGFQQQPLSTSSASHAPFPLPEIQISEFPPQFDPSHQTFFQGGSFPTSPASSPNYSMPPIVDASQYTTRSSTSPTSSGYSSPLSLSGSVPTFHVTSAMPASAGSGSSTSPSLSSSSSGSNKRKKPPKKKQASLPNLLPAPPASSPGTAILSTSPTSSSSFPSVMTHLSPTSSPPFGNSPPTSPRPPLLGRSSSWSDLQQAGSGKPATLTVPGMGMAVPKIIRVNYDEVIFSAAKTPSKVTVVCTPTSLRPLGVECLINRPNLPQPVVVQPTQISIHDDSNEQRVATCTVIECHFPFPTVMKTCVGGVKVANVQFRLFHTPPASSAPILLDSFYKEGDVRHLPMVAYPHTKAKIQCWAIVIWYADRGPEYEQLTWAELAKRFAYFYKRQLNENMHPQSIRFLGEKLGIPHAGKESSKDEIVTFETYMQTRVGHWLFNAVQAIKTYYDLWKNYSLRMFLTHKDAVILLKQMGAKPGDFLFRIPSQLAEEDTKAFKTRSPSSNLVFTYVQKVGDEIKFAKVDVNDKTREDPKFVHEKKELVNLLCLNEKGDMVLKHKMECYFNEKQKKMRENAGFKGTVKASGDDGDEYETY